MERLYKGNIFIETDRDTRECGKMGKEMDKVAFIILKFLV